MDRTAQKQKDLEAGQRVQERIQYYFLTLTFTLLALSVQTAKFDGTNTEAIIELTGWALLFISGVVGLLRLDQIPRNYKLSIHMQSFKENIDDAISIQKEDPSLPPDKKLKINEFIEDQKKGFNHFESQKNALLENFSKLYWVHKYGLLLGLFFVLISRGLPPIRSIMG